MSKFFSLFTYQIYFFSPVFIVNCSRNFSQHSDLGMVIGAIKQELKKSSLQLQNPGARSQGVAALSPSYCVLPPSAGSAVNTSPDPLRYKS